MTKRDNEKIGLFLRRDGNEIKGGLEGSSRNNTDVLKGSLYYNFTRQTPEFEGKMKSTDLGNGKIKVNGEGIDGEYCYPQSVRRWLYKTAGLMAFTTGITTYFTSSNLDLYNRIGESLGIASIIALGVIAFGYKLGLFRKNRIQISF